MGKKGYKINGSETKKDRRKSMNRCQWFAVTAGCLKRTRVISKKDKQMQRTFRT